MESILVGENCKGVTLSSGYELPYCEFGEENEEVVVTGAFYFHTFNTFLKELAKSYHVYGFVMRMHPEGIEQELNPDGSINWTREWGAEVYDACRQLGLDSFHYVGKCHGAMPGWYLLKEHPECLRSLTSISNTLHDCPQDKDDWTAKQKELGPKFMLLALKKHELLQEKVKEAQLVQTTGTVGANAIDPRMGYYGSHPEAIFYDDYDAVSAFIPTIKTPICDIFATEDILYYDFQTANEHAMYRIPGVKTILLQGERHLLEMDCPKRLAHEVRAFIEGAALPYE